MALLFLSFCFFSIVLKLQSILEGAQSISVFQTLFLSERDGSAAIVIRSWMKAGKNVALDESASASTPAAVDWSRALMVSNL